MIFAQLSAASFLMMAGLFRRTNHLNRQEAKMQEKQNGSEKQENDCNRSGIDRRQFSYSYHIPERRSGKDRRRGFDRRYGFSRRSGMERRDH